MATIYILKIYKPGTKVFRICRVPGSITLDQLHQQIHEWLEFPTYEMYGFFPNNKLLSESGYYAPQMQKRSAADVRLDQLKLQREQRILYVYDMTELMQFYIHVDDIFESDNPEIRLLRQNGYLNFGQEPEPQTNNDPDSWKVYGQEISMEECVITNDPLDLMDTLHCMNIEVEPEWTDQDLAREICLALSQDDLLVFRLLPLHLLQLLTAIWRAQDGDTVNAPYELLVRLSLLGFICLDETEDDRILLYSMEARDWLTGLLESGRIKRYLERYNRWHMIARGMLFTYGVMQMDEFLEIMKRHLQERPTVDEMCDFMMQRMEWNEECHALEDGNDLYWSVPEAEKAAAILEKRKMYTFKYKAIGTREIMDNAETAGWQKVDCGQELFQALQGMAMEPDEIRETLNRIVSDFTHGLEPREVMEDCIPPVNQIGRAAYAKIRHMLRQVRRQLPDYTLKGYSVEEMEKRDPSYHSFEGITILKGGNT